MADILLVDDDGNVLLTLAISLRRLGHKVTVACDAEQALNHLADHRYAFLISDTRMPGMSGVELALQVSRMQCAPRVILTSAYSNVVTRDDIVEAFLQKPIDTERLNTLLSSKKPYSQLHSTPYNSPSVHSGRLSPVTKTGSLS